MTQAKTLLELAGADLSPARVDDAALVLIDFQNEYRSGPIAVENAGTAIDSAGRILEAARRSASPLFHITHRGRAGSLFDREAERGQIVAELSPRDGEEVVEKTLPNAFAHTALQSLLEATGRRDIIVVGFMTHMCVSATARAAVDLGYRVTIDASSCGTRALPDGRGGVFPAATVHDVALAELADRFAVVARDTGQIV